jgi:signal transduction histidine kinase/CheY-like chemotaxis protein
VQQRIVESLRAILGTQNCVLFRHEPASGDLIAVAFSGERGDPFDPILTLPRGTGMAGLALRERHPVATTDLLADPRVVFTPELRARFEQASFRSSLSAPLVVKDRVIGALSLGDRLGRAFNAQEIQLAQSFADQAGVALENARLYEETERRRREAEELGRVSRTLAESLDVSTVGERIVQGVVRLFAAQTAVVWLVQPDNSMIVLASTGPAQDLVPRGDVFPPGVGLAGRAIAESQSVWSSDILSQDGILIPDDRRRRLTDSGSTAVLAVPLSVKGKTIGALATLDRTGRVFSKDEVALLEAFAAQGALALENARLLDDARRSYEDLRQTQEHLVRVERLRALGEMAGGVAHDFNNLLAVILGRAQYLKMGLSQLGPEAVTRSLGIIEQSARDGAETVRHLFEFTRGVPAEPPGPVNINEVVTEAVAASEPRWKDEAEARGITVFVETDLTAIRPALGKASQLREALLNLIFNGVEAMPEGGRLSLATWDDDHGVWLRVADQGTGMEDEVRRRVFEPFFTTKGPQRSGLGLSMVYGIITHHGGTITIEESEGKGTAFLIRLPQSEVPKPASVTSPVPAVPASTVLVIDDEEGVREILADILGSTGHTVVLAASGSEGLEWVERQPFDLICTDLGMPGMSGWQVVEGVKALRPEAPVALITGWGAQIRPEELSAHHADFLLTKPFQISEVLTTLAEARALRNGERANGG